MKTYPIFVENVENKKRPAFINWFLPIYYVLAQYAFIISNVGTVVMILAATLQFIVHKRIKIHKGLLVFIVYCTLVQLLFHTMGNLSITTLNNIMMPLIFLFIISVFIDDINEDDLYKTYFWIGVIVMAGMFYQSIGYYFLDKSAIPIKILPVADAQAHYWGYFMGHRPSSFFAEPQAYSSYIMPLLFLSMKRKKFIFSIIISISILLSTSSQGIIIMFFVWGTYLAINTKGIVNKILVAGLTTVFVYSFFNFSVFEFGYEKIMNINWSNNIRLTRGFEVFSTFSLKDKFLGLGTGGLVNYLISDFSAFDWIRPYVQSYGDYILGYHTGVSGTFITYGLGGGLLLFYMFYKMARYDDKSNFIFLLVIILSFFVQSMLFNAWFLFYILFYLGVSDKEIFEKNYTVYFL